ncbi:MULTISPECIES: DUF2279 domain-containing protein [unclassified Lacinutrix]|uniref:DUF2279 domain-containing protein n=1 Tax=unclassified Lacinutrix TaxID=2647285 RepID=UPI00020A3CCA|nr:MULTISPECIES: DUF2279 domain-containing protein [unclassified Lacinutrix]AEG99858.1 hypothetical protein Lacal_0006 [Lacinutrix sp. 5H-3-7-4]OIQ16319.1 MAG: DUF2279 domain-containing protein [Lacinutrix sp. MedPE-SW]
MFIKLTTYVLVFLFSVCAFAQESSFFKPSDTLNIKRRNTVVISEAAIGGVTLLALNQLWYADYERSNFHTINDNSEWLQMDKFGHTFSAYHLGRLGAQTLKWSGVSKKNQLLYGGTLGFTFLTAVEVMDGFSQEWGFSWGDFTANAAGTGLFIGQELLWDEQRIVMKYSFHRTQFAAQRPDKLGNGLTEEFLKDYNGQTYWLSANVHSFFKSSKIPKWLNVAFGYGVDGLLSGNDNLFVDNVFIQQDRQRQFYLSLDVDLTKIKTNSALLKTVFSVFNTIKVPFPTLEINGENGIKLHAIYF